MGQPTWRNVKTVKVPAKNGAVWTPTLDYLTPGRLYRIRVEAVTIPAAIGAIPIEQQPGEVPPRDVAPAPVGVPVAPLAEGMPRAAPAPPPKTEEQTWTPEDASSPCTADGDTIDSQRTDPLPLPDVRVGTLIARIGGSTADQVGDKDKTILFSVGRHCVFHAPDAPKVGTLYLGMNDTSKCASHIGGQLEVKIFEAL